MKELLSKIEHKLKKLLSFRRMNPHVYWRNILYMFFVTMVVLILFSLYFLFNIKNQEIFQITPKSTKSPSLMNEKLLNKITESFDIKLIKEKEIKDGLILYKDPSLK